MVRPSPEGLTTTWDIALLTSLPVLEWIVVVLVCRMFVNAVMDARVVTEAFY